MTGQVSLDAVKWITTIVEALSRGLHDLKSVRPPSYADCETQSSRRDGIQLIARTITVAICSQIGLFHDRNSTLVLLGSVRVRIAPRPLHLRRN